MHSFEKDSITMVVPIRSGSQRVQGKNLRKFYDLPDGTSYSLLEWKLTQLLRVVSPRQILVSSDWDLALQVAADMGVVTSVRPVELAQSQTPFGELLRHCGDLIETEHMAWAPVTSPFMAAHDYERAIRHYLELDSASQENGLICASEERTYFFMGGGAINFPLGLGHVQTQDVLPLSMWNWAFSIRPTQLVARESYMFGETPTIHPISKFANFDIDYEEDFEVAQLLASHFSLTNRENF